MGNFQKLKNFALDLFFPRFCQGCGKEKTWLCPDCQALLEIQAQVFCPICEKRAFDFKTHPGCRKQTYLSGLFWAVSYDNPLIKKLILNFKHRSLAKELAQPLTRILISHFLLTEFSFKKYIGQTYGNSQFVLVPIPLTKKRLRWRGFNQAELLAQELAEFFSLALATNILIRTKETIPQMEIKNPEKRKANIKGVFSCPVQPSRLNNLKILLIDDVCTSRATLEEAARTLKQAGAKEIWAAVLAHG